MHNLKEIRKNIDNYKKKLKERNIDVNFEELIKLDKNNRDLIQKNRTMVPIGTICYGSQDMVLKACYREA